MQYKKIVIILYIGEHLERRAEEVNEEQRANADKLEEIAEQLQKVADLFNLAGYKCSPYELHQIDKIAQLAATCQKLARM